MDSVIEKQRQLHEELDKLVQGSAHTSAYKFGSQRSKVNAMHLQKLVLDRAKNTSTELLNIYRDETGARKAEVSALSGNEFGSFYRKLQEVREYHKNAPTELVRPYRVDLLPEFLQPEGLLEAQRRYANTRKEEPPQPLSGLVSFSGEESSGRFLDVHAQHDMYNNFKCVPEHSDYMTFVDTFDKFETIPQDFKKSVSYIKYVKSLGSYLVDFHRRAFPLVDIDKELAKGEAQFESLWACSRVRGWENVKPLASTGAAPLDLSQYETAEQLAGSVGMDELKGGLVALGLKCGGTAQQRAERLMMTKGVDRKDWKKSILAKATKSQGGPAEDPRKDVARSEAVVYVMCKVLAQIRHNTIENIERRMARSAAEFASSAGGGAEGGADDDEEREDGEIEFADSDDEEESKESRKSKRGQMVVGWDGKPIPYWLYRLHGLNVMYSCEICGNTTYRGPKAFQQHFTEWRHAQGMRQLGIPNTKHFSQVTNINDARALWEALKEKKAKERFEADQEEEYEDSLGNVISKKTYEDLVRQGLI